LDSVMLTQAETIDIRESVTAEGAMPEVAMEEEGIDLEVAEIPKSPQLPRPRLTQTQEGTIGKKGKQAATPLVCVGGRNWGYPNG